MEVAISLACPCRPNFAYKNEVSLAAHKRSKMHRTWELSLESKQDKVRSKEFENEIERLRRRLVHKEAVEVELLARIRQLEHELARYDGVYI